MLYKIKAIVLGGRDFGEADKIITLYSKERGKIRAIAKGIRKTKSKFGSSLEPFMLSNLLIYSKYEPNKQMSTIGGNSLDIITDAHIQDSFINLRGSLSGFAYGSFFADLVDKMTFEGEPEYKVFNLLKEFLTLVRSKGNNGVLTYGFVLRLFNILGYHPKINECAECNMEIKIGGKFKFSVSSGGVLCNNCKNIDVDALPLLASSLQYLKRLIRLNSRYLKNLKISRHSEAEIKNIIENYINFYIGRDLNSFSFLKQIMEEPCNI